MKIQRLLRGTYLLEFSLVTLGVAAFAVAALDLLTLYRTRSALQAAVDTGLRCLYPLDADCQRRGAVNETGAGGLFDVYRVINPSEPLPPDYVPVEQWQAAVSADWYQVPSREVAYVSVSFDEPRPAVPALVEETTFPVISQQARFVVVAGLPEVNGPVFNERFVRSGNVGPAGQTLGSGSLVGGSTDRSCSPADFDPRCVMGEQSFGPVNAILNPDQLGNLPVPPQCPGVMADGECRVPAYLVVRGRSSGAIGSQGKVTLEIDYGDGNKRPLGGRLFASSNDADLVPRGVSWNEVESKSFSKSFEPYKEELTAHANLLVPLYGKFRIRFYLQSLSGDRVEWNATEMRVFTPVYEVQKSTVECGYRASSEDQIDRSKPCPGGTDHRMIDPSRSSTESRSIGCVNSAESDSEVADRLGFRLAVGTKVVRQFAEKECSPIIRTTLPCPTSAVFSELACGSIGSGHGERLCPAPAGSVAPEWKTEEKSVNMDDVTVCQEQAGGLNCGDAVFESSLTCSVKTLKKYRDPTAPFLLRTCGQGSEDQRNLEMLLRDTASKRVPTQVPVHFEMQHVGTLICDPQVDPDGCECFKRAKEGTVPTRTLCAAGVRRNSAAATACCGSGIGKCEFVQTRLPSSSTKHETVRESLDRARVVAEEAAGAILGGFSRCDQSSDDQKSQQCGTITFDQDTQVATGSGQVAVPLRLLRLAPGEGSVMVSYSASRPLEIMRLRD